jgi:thiol-disulfide isomerase/thioredoxin
MLGIVLGLTLALTGPADPVSEVLQSVSEAGSKPDITQVADEVLKALPAHSAESLIRDWVTCSQDLGDARKLASFYTAYSGESPEWAADLTRSNVSGRLFPFVNAAANSVHFTFHLQESDTAETPELNAIRVSAWVRQIRDEEELFSAPRLSWVMTESSRATQLGIDVMPFQEGDLVEVFLSLEIFLRGAPGPRQLKLERLFEIKANQSGHLWSEQRGDDGPLLKEAMTLEIGYRNLFSRWRIQKLIQARIAEEGLRHASEDSPLLGTRHNVVLRDWETELENAVGSTAELTIEGKVTLLDFWATWCSPCIGAMPHVEELHTKHGDDFQVVSICKTDNPEDYVGIERIASRFGHLFAKGAPETLSRFHVEALPTLILLDKKGTVRWLGIGADASPPDDFIQELLRQE